MNRWAINMFCFAYASGIFYMINLHLGWLMKRFINGKQVQKPGAPTRLETQEPLNTRL